MLSISEKWTYMGYVLSPTHWEDADTGEYSGKTTYHLWKLFEKKKSGKREYRLVVSGDYSSSEAQKYKTYSPRCSKDKIEVSNWVSGGAIPSNFKDSSVPINNMTRKKSKSADVIPFRIVKDDE